MPNKSYVKGRRKEYKVMNELKEDGFIAFRSAGSHSPIDVVGIHPERRHIRLIQCKPSSMSKNQKDKINVANKSLNGDFLVGFEVV